MDAYAQRCAFLHWAVLFLTDDLYVLLNDVATLQTALFPEPFESQAWVLKNGRQFTFIKTLCH